MLKVSTFLKSQWLRNPELNGGERSALESKLADRNAEIAELEAKHKAEFKAKNAELAALNAEIDRIKGGKTTSKKKRHQRSLSKVAN